MTQVFFSLFRSFSGLSSSFPHGLNQFFILTHSFLTKCYEVLQANYQNTRDKVARDKFRAMIFDANGIVYAV